ncbi:hypothetical protein ACOYW6_12540 [Parablastomonas sp. CN1-191]|uniref:hypothetical protein n=1 Tax=Parablastomonas sp. CN1-191 TaxID=3400908 RepID=UPI003BF7B192
MLKPALPASLVLALAACSGGAPAPEASGSVAAADVAEPTAAATSTATPSASAQVAQVLTLDGLGELRFGKPIAADSHWKLGTDEASPSCRIATSPDYPGVYAIVNKDGVRRITVGARSTVKLVEGVGPGSSETEVTAKFPGFRESPHKYVAAPGKYLTAPGEGKTGPDLRFEIGADGKVSLMHVGIAPELQYVEGCS